jgi:hypoxanthine phosphoribosyltransferase
MIYEVVNKPKRIEAVLLDSAVSFACGYLQLNTSFTIEFESLKKHQCGYCDYDEDEAVVVIAKRLPVKEAIRTLFHELVHLKQYETGRLEVGSPQRWLGISIEDKYENLPWEVEAFELEEKMMKSFYG